MSRIYVVTVEGRRGIEGWCERHALAGIVYLVERGASNHILPERRALAAARNQRASDRAERLRVIERILLDAIAERYALQSSPDGHAWFDAIDREDEAKAAYLAHVLPGVDWRRRILGLP